jgi:hypothetical protein
MGLAGAPHCAAMCGAACAGISRGQDWRGRLAFHLGRIISYAVGGALAAASVSVLGQMAQASAALHPLWMLLHVAALLLGLSLLWLGRQPAWLMNLGQNLSRSAPGVVRWAPRQAGLRSALAGLAWLAWPCGLLQSALVLAALASGPLWGAATMTVFALISGVGLVIGPAALWRLLGVARAEQGMQWAARVAGLLLAIGSGWALGHGLWARVAPYCAI